MKEELAWDTLPVAFRVHCWLEVEAPSAQLHQNVLFEPDDGETGCWATKAVPTDGCGPAHVIYFESHIEVHRYSNPDSVSPQLAARIGWDAPDLLDKVLTAATQDTSPH